MFKSSLDNGELLVSLCYKPHLERLAVGIFEGKNLNKLDVYAPPGKQSLSYMFSDSYMVLLVWPIDGLNMPINCKYRYRYSVDIIA